MGLHLTAPHPLELNWLPLCSFTNVNLSRAAHDLQTIARKGVISPTDLKVATRVVDTALQVHALLEHITRMLLAVCFVSLYKHCKYIT